MAKLNHTAIAAQSNEVKEAVNGDVPLASLFDSQQVSDDDLSYDDEGDVIEDDLPLELSDPFADDADILQAQMLGEQAAGNQQSLEPLIEAQSEKDHRSELFSTYSDEEAANAVLALNSTIAPVTNPDEDTVSTMPPKVRKAAKDGKLKPVKKNATQVEVQTGAQKREIFDVENLEEEAPSSPVTRSRRPQKRKNDEELPAPSPKKAKQGGKGRSRSAAHTKSTPAQVQTEGLEPAADELPLPEEAEQIVSVPAQTKKRGRPRKESALVQDHESTSDVQNTAEPADAPTKKGKAKSAKSTAPDPVRRSTRNQKPNDTTESNANDRPSSSQKVTGRSSNSTAKGRRTSTPTQKANTSSKRQSAQTSSQDAITIEEDVANEAEDDAFHDAHENIHENEDSERDEEEDSDDNDEEREEYDTQKGLNNPEALFGVLPGLGEVFKLIARKPRRRNGEQCKAALETKKGTGIIEKIEKCSTAYRALVDDDGERSHEELWQSIERLSEYLLKIVPPKAEQQSTALRQDIYYRVFPCLLQLLKDALRYYQHEAQFSDQPDISASNAQLLIVLITTIIAFERHVSTASWATVKIDPKNPVTNHIRHGAISKLAMIVERIESGIAQEEERIEFQTQRENYEADCARHNETRLRDQAHQEAQQKRQRWWSELNGLRTFVENHPYRRGLIALGTRKPWIWPLERDTDSNGEEFERVEVFSQRASDEQSHRCKRPIPPGEKMDGGKWSDDEMGALQEALIEADNIVDAKEKFWYVFQRCCTVSTDMYGSLRRFNCMEIYDMARNMKKRGTQDFESRGMQVPLWLTSIPDWY